MDKSVERYQIGSYVFFKDTSFTVTVQNDEQAKYSKVLQEMFDVSWSKTMDKARKAWETYRGYDAERRLSAVDMINAAAAEVINEIRADARKIPVTLGGDDPAPVNIQVPDVEPQVTVEPTSPVSPLQAYLEMPTTNGLDLMTDDQIMRVLIRAASMSVNGAYAYEQYNWFSQIRDGGLSFGRFDSTDNFFITREEAMKVVGQYTNNRSDNLFSEPTAGRLTRRRGAIIPWMTTFVGLWPNRKRLYTTRDPKRAVSISRRQRSTSRMRDWVKPWRYIQYTTVTAINGRPKFAWFDDSPKTETYGKIKRSILSSWGLPGIQQPRPFTQDLIDNALEDGRAEFSWQQFPTTVPITAITGEVSDPILKFPQAIVDDIERACQLLESVKNWTENNAGPVAERREFLDSVQMAMIEVYAMRREIAAVDTVVFAEAVAQRDKAWGAAVRRKREARSPGARYDDTQPTGFRQIEVDDAPVGEVVT